VRKKKCVSEELYAAKGDMDKIQQHFNRMTPCISAINGGDTRRVSLFLFLCNVQHDIMLIMNKKTRAGVFGA